MRSFLQKYLYSDEVPLQARVVNLILIIGFEAACAFFVLRLIFGFNWFILGLNLFAMLAIGILFFLANHTQQHVRIGWITAIAIADLVWPLSFFFVGGANSGIAAYFVFSIVIIFLLIKGSGRIVMLVVHLALAVEVYALAYYYPELITPMPAELLPVDSILSFVVVGLSIGAILIYKDKLYETENKKVQEYNTTLAKAHASIVEQDKLLAANNDAAKLLLTARYEDFDITVKNAMQQMGKLLGIERIYVWKNVPGSHGKRYACFYGWNAPGAAKEETKGKEELDYRERIPRWHELFLKNEVVNCPVAELPLNESKRLSDKGITTILAIPIYIVEEYWGFASYDHCDDYQAFSADTVSILRSFSLMLVNAIIKAELDKERGIALEQAVQASRAKGDFLSNMSHEMRTPMNAIIGMTSIGLTADSLARKDYAFEKIDNASKHLLGVINDILDMSKIEAGKLELSLEEFNMSALVDRVVDVMNFRIEERKLTLTVSKDMRIPPLLIGDDQRLSQVITNLLSNAIKFTDEGGKIFLDTELLCQQDDKVEIKVIIRDTGIGMSEEQVERLFQSFEQAERGTSRKFGGTGLGLPISKNIVEMMGGTIWAASELERGSTFSFSVILGLARGSEGFGDDIFFSSIDTLQPREKTLKKKKDFSKYRILLAEDVEINQEIVKALLEHTQVAIDVAQNGCECLRLFAAAPEDYDMIFMDVQMPKMDGLDTTRQIRALDNAWAKEIPIVAMTANVFKEDIEKCLSVGMNDHVGKPINLDEVLEKMQEYLGKQR